MTEQQNPQPAMENDSTISRRKIWRLSLALGIGVSLIYLAFLKPGIWGIDGNELYWVSHSLVTKGSFAVPKGAGVLGRGGEYYPMRYPLLPIIATPFVAIGLGLGHLLDLPVRYVATLCALVVSVLLTAISTSFVALLAIRLGSTPKKAYIAALCYAFGTTAMVYSREFFSEPLLALITIVSVYLAIGKSYKEHALASILSGFALLAKPAGIVLGPLLTLYFFCKKYPWRAVIGPLLGTGVGFLLYLGYNYIRFESFFTSGQDYDRFQIAGVILRFLGLLFSPGTGGGLFWYCPPTILAFLGFRKLYKSKPLDALLVMGIFVAYLCLNSLWSFRGWNWGPRILVPTLPILMALTAFIPKRWWTLLLLLTLLGFFWNAPTLVIYYQRYFAEAADTNRFIPVFALWGDPLDAPIFNIWGVMFRQLQEALSTDVKTVLNDIGLPPSTGDLSKSDLFKIVAVWWWVVPAAGIPIWVGFGIAMILLGLGIWILRKGWLIVSDQ